MENPSQPVFIVEGEIDAMSIIQVGGEAVGLGSLSMTEKLLDYVESVLPKQPLIFALDNDKGGSEAGNKAQKKIEERREQLEEKGLIIHFADVENLYSGHKDANEALCAEFFEFAPKVEEEKRLSYRSKELRQEALVAELRKDSVLHRMPDFMQCIEDSKTRSYVPTGFPILEVCFLDFILLGLSVLLERQLCVCRLRIRLHSRERMFLFSLWKCLETNLLQKV